MASKVVVVAAVFAVRLSRAFFQAVGDFEVLEPLLGRSFFFLPVSLCVSYMVVFGMASERMVSWVGRLAYRQLYFSSWPGASAEVTL